jgi:hypothetical protein
VSALVDGAQPVREGERLIARVGEEDATRSDKLSQQLSTPVVRGVHLMTYEGNATAKL